MISRRLLRIKVLQILYAHFQSGNCEVEKSEKELFYSIKKTYELYHYLLLMICDIVSFAKSRIDLARQKHIPTLEDLNPNTQFIDNKLVKQLSVNKQLNYFISHPACQNAVAGGQNPGKSGGRKADNKISWVNHPELIKKLFSNIKDSKSYHNYINSDNNSYEADKQIIINIFKNEIADFELLYQILEEESIYWNDDVEFVISMIIKTVKNFKEEDNENARLMPLYKSMEDKDFVKTLLRMAILKSKEYKELIDNHTENWDIKRIALVDKLIMQLAIAEILEISSIPIRVSFNEYIEISKFYSTSKSSTFINGILDKIISFLKKDNKIKKD